MRVSDKWMYEHGAMHLSRSRQAHQKAVDEVSSGVRVEHPWEDPGAAGRAARHDTAIRQHDAVGTTIQRANDELASIDAGFSDVIDSLSRARELAVQLSNDSYSPSERAGGGAEVSGLFQSVIATLNRQVAGRYVFGGFKDQSPPFDASGNFVGDGNVRKVEVAPGVWQEVTVPTDAVIMGTAGGIDVPRTLADLATALKANDTVNIRASLDQLSDAITQVSQARSQAGSYAAVLDVAALSSRAARDDETTQLSNEVDANPFEAASRLALAERGLEASIEAASRSGKLSLLGKM